MKKKPAKPQKPAAKQKPKPKAVDPIEAAIEKAFGSFLSKLGLDQEPAVVPASIRHVPPPTNGHRASRQQLDRAENQLFAPLTETSDVPDTSDASDWGNVSQVTNDVPMNADNVRALLNTQRTMLEVMVNKFKGLENRMNGIESVLKASGAGRGMSTGGL